MRLKITRELRGSIDGIQLVHFVPGEVYDVSAAFGTYLLAEQAAELVPEPPSAASGRDRADDGPRPPGFRVRK